MSKSIKILAIETSCDETAASVIEGKLASDNQLAPVILSNIVSSQVDLHAKTGGVVPEVASRAHMEAIMPVIVEAILCAKNQNNSSKTNTQIKPEQYQEAVEYIKKEIDYIAVTAGPGLIGSLLVGYNAAKTLAHALKKPLLTINHIEGHIYSAFSRIELSNTNYQLSKKAQENEDNFIKFPLLALTVSGGHTSITLVKNHGKYENIGHTLDDAAGEAFDKVAKLLDLGYPGGPAISKLAEQFRNYYQLPITSEQSIINVQLLNEKINGNLKKIENCKSEIENSPKRIEFPRPIMNDGTFNFSFSGLKTAVLQKVIELKKDIFLSGHPELDSGSSEISDQIRNGMTEFDLPLEVKAEIAAAFEDAAVDVLVAKTIRAAEKYKVESVILAGGVAANKHLRESMQLAISNKLSAKFIVPPINLCGDNAAMIGLAAFYRVQNNINLEKIDEINSNLPLE